MSVRVMSLVWDNFNRGGSEKLAMLALADWCNDEGGSLHPSISSVAKKINVSEKQARRIIHQFIEDGYLTVTGNLYGGNPGQSRQYRLNVAKLATPPMDVTPPASVTPPMDVRDPSHGCPFTPPMDGSQTTSEPSIEPSVKSRTAPATRLPEDWVPSADDLEFCKTERPDLNPKTLADGFRDYWISVPGAKGKKLDWRATWRNWVRNQRAKPQAPPSKQSNRDSYAAQAQAAQERLNGGSHEPTERDITGQCSRVA